MKENQVKKQKLIVLVMESFYLNNKIYVTRTSNNLSIATLTDLYNLPLARYIPTCFSEQLSFPNVAVIVSFSLQREFTQTLILVIWSQTDVMWSHFKFH